MEEELLLREQEKVSKLNKVIPKIYKRIIRQFNMKNCLNNEIMYSESWLAYYNFQNSSLLFSTALILF